MISQGRFPFGGAFILGRLRGLRFIAIRRGDGVKVDGAVSTGTSIASRNGTTFLWGVGGSAAIVWMLGSPQEREIYAR
jgi:hypothetical protein